MATEIFISEASTNYNQETRVASASASTHRWVTAILNSIDSFHTVPRDSQSHILTSLAPMQYKLLF